MLWFGVVAVCLLHPLLFHDRTYTYTNEAFLLSVTVRLLSWCRARLPALALCLRMHVAVPKQDAIKATKATQTYQRE